MFLLVEDAGTSGMLLVNPHKYNQTNHLTQTLSQQ
jgi:hypothetical protein